MNAMFNGVKNRIQLTYTVHVFKIESYSIMLCQHDRNGCKVQWKSKTFLEKNFPLSHHFIIFNCPVYLHWHPRLSEFSYWEFFVVLNDISHGCKSLQQPCLILPSDMDSVTVMVR